MLTGLTHFNLKHQAVHSRSDSMIASSQMLTKLQTREKVYPVHYVPDDPQPVVLALDPVDRLFLAQVMADVIEVAVEKDLPLPLCLYDHFPLLLFFGSHVVQFALFKGDTNEERDKL